MRSVLKILRKIAPPRGPSSKSRRNRAPARSILKIWMKIARSIPRILKKNRAPARSILKIWAPTQSVLRILRKIALPCGASSKLSGKSRSRAEHPQNFEEIRSPVRSILNIWKKITLPRGASSKFHKNRSRAIHTHIHTHTRTCPHTHTVKSGSRCFTLKLNLQEFLGDLGEGTSSGVDFGRVLLLSVIKVLSNGSCSLLTRTGNISA